MISFLSKRLFKNIWRLYTYPVMIPGIQEGKFVHFARSIFPIVFGVVEILLKQYQADFYQNQASSLSENIIRHK